jgi:adenylate kinase family enzyme
MECVAIFGTSGSGKTTLARRLAESLSLRHIEVDGIYHQANWTPLDDEEFVARLDEATKRRGWITDGNYTAVRPLLVDRADTVVWLDYPRRITTFRVIRRTVRRAVRREVLWNGNREALSNLFRLDPERSVIRWSFTTHGRNRAVVQELIGSGALDHCTVLRFDHPRATKEWLRTLHASEF